MTSVTKDIVRVLIDEGKLIESGFEIMRRMAISPDAPQIQIDEMRLAFMAGAQHLFGSMMTIMDSDELPTADDIRRMEAIQKELEDWEDTIMLRLGPAQGEG